MFCDSVWFVHKLPRLVRVNAVCVQQQIAGTYPLDHEVAVLALRRFNQLDVGAHAVSKYMLWREVLEPDFSVSIRLSWFRVDVPVLICP